jgi:hypothetical protein
LDDPTTVYLNNIKIIEGYAMNEGGFVYAKGNTLSPTATFTIDNTINGNAMMLEEFKSDYHGGGFYVNNPKLSIFIKKIAVKNSKAMSGYGGFFFFNEVSQVSITSSTFEDVFSTAFGSLLYSVATGLQLSVTGS